MSHGEVMPCTLMGIIVVLDQFIAVAGNCYSLRCNFLSYSTEDISIAGIVMAAGSVRVAVAVSSAGFSMPLDLIPTLVLYEFVISAILLVSLPTSLVAAEFPREGSASHGKQPRGPDCRCQG